jgi:hypothetical protein
MKPSKGLRTYFAVSSLIICIMALPKDAGAVCSTEERRDMAIDGMSRVEIDRECEERGPITGTVCGTLHGKCRLERPLPFFFAL